MVFFLLHPLDQRNGAGTLGADPIILSRFVNFVKFVIYVSHGYGYPWALNMAQIPGLGSLKIAGSAGVDSLPRMALRWG
jgi:hypothetical protein